MNDNLLFLIVLCTAGALLMTVIYAKFKRGLTSKMFALIIPTEIVVAELSFILGGAGAPLHLLVTLVPIGVGVVVVALLLIYRITIQPLTPLSRAMDRIAEERDLTILPYVTDRHDEVSQIQTAFHTMTVNLRGILGKLQDGVQGLAASASEITATAAQAASTATEQATVVAEVSTTVEEIKVTSNAAADAAQRVATVSDEALEAGRRGVSSVEEAVRIVRLVADQVNAAGQRMKELSERSDQVGEIIASVNELADQSNLLAVNASIEAARAGERGLAFGAVASEVRSLAEQSKAATKQVQAILGDIRGATDALVAATEQSQERTLEAHQAIETVRTFMGSLLAVLEESADQARQISGASAQQAAGVEQIAEAMKQVAQGGAETQQSARQLERAVVDLSAVGTRLQEMGAAYRV